MSTYTKNKNIIERLSETNDITEEILDEMVEYTTYGSLGMFNWVIDGLQVVAEKIRTNQVVRYEKYDRPLTMKTFKELVESKFGEYIVKGTFKSYDVENISLNDKVYFDIKNTPEGLELIYNEKKEVKLFKWIADISEDYSLVQLIPTGVVYIRHSKTKQISPFLSEHNSCYIYDNSDGKIKEVGI